MKDDRRETTRRKAQNVIFAAVILAAVFTSPAPGQTAPVVNVNTATLEQLQYLPRIGPAKADAIVWARSCSDGPGCPGGAITFRKLEDLLKVSGVGEKTLEKLKPYVVFEGETTATAKLESTAKGGAAKFKRPDDG